MGGISFFLSCNACKLITIGTASVGLKKRQRASSHTQLSCHKLVPGPLGVDLVEDAAAVALAQLRAVQVLELGARRTRDVVVLAKEAPLPDVGQGVDLVAPAATVVEPRRGRIWVGRGGDERLSFADPADLVVPGVARVPAILLGVVVVVRVVVERGVPDGSLVRHVLEHAEWQDVGVLAGQGIHGVRTDGRVYDGADAALLDGIPRIRLASLVLGKENAPRLAILETDHAVLPIADMVPETNAQNGLAEVVRVKEEPKGVDDAGALVDDDKDGRGLGVAVGIGLVAAARDAGRLGPAPLPVRLWPRIGDTMQGMLLVDIKPAGGLLAVHGHVVVVHDGVLVAIVAIVGEGAGSIEVAVEPIGPGLDVVKAVQHHEATVLVELVEVIEGPFVGLIEHFAVDRDIHVLNVFPDVRGPELLARVEVDEGRVLGDIVGYVLEYLASLGRVALHVRSLPDESAGGVFGRVVGLLPRPGRDVGGKRPAAKLSEDKVAGVIVIVAVAAGGRIGVEEGGRVTPQVVEAADADPAA